MPGLDSNRGAKRAREARAALGVDRVAPLACLLTVIEEQVGLPVVVARLPDQVAGACYRDGDRAVLWVNGAQPRQRQRFTLAHELGHAWCRHEGALEVDTFATLSGRTSNPYEIQANAFAAEFLIPKAGLHELIEGDPTLEEVVVIAAHFGVSAIVVVYRLDELRLASTAHLGRLKAEVEERLHEDTFHRLGLTPLDDRLGAIERLPYLSPSLAGTHLDAALRGEAPADDAVAGAVARLLT